LQVGYALAFARALQVEFAIALQVRYIVAFAKA